jgi:hypothetical protein
MKSTSPRRKITKRRTARALSALLLFVSAPVLAPASAQDVPDPNAIQHQITQDLTPGEGGNCPSCDAQNHSHFFPADGAKLQSWDPSHFSDPAHFDPQKFRFLYQTVTASSWPNIPADGFARKILENPELVQGNPKLSVSVIDQDHRAIFAGGIGLILGVPPDNLIFTETSDAGTPMYSMSSDTIYSKMDDFRHVLATTGGRDKLLTPDEVLAGTGQPGKSAYNENGVMGTEPTTGEKIQVKAVVITAKFLGCTARHEGPIQNQPPAVFSATLKKCGLTPDVASLVTSLKGRYPILLLNL